MVILKSLRRGADKAVVGMMAVSLFVASPLSVYATTAEDVKKQQEDTKEQIEELNDQMDSIASEKAAVNSEIAELDTELLDILTSISICEDEIAAKEDEIVVVKGKLQEAEAAELQQYEDMKTRIRFMYEKGDTAYVQIFMEGTNITDILNKAAYAERIYEYDRDMLKKYTETKQQVATLKDSLENEEADLVAAQGELKEEQSSLESLIASKRATVANFDAQLASARSKVEGYKKQLNEQTKKIRELEEVARKEKEEKEKAAKAKAEKEKAEKELTLSLTSVDEDEKEQTGKKSEEKSETETATADTSASDEKLIEATEKAATAEDINVGEANEKESKSVSNSALGNSIASFACQFVGNPYVPGGTSLTDGADCSGFTQSVYSNFGIKIPRDSTSQRSAGREVSYDEAQPGDIICYAGHVAIYIGNGQIVHASTQKTGIKIGNATYRTILSVRRFT